jgi:hypothetical protein
MRRLICQRSPIASDEKSARDPASRTRSVVSQGRAAILLGQLGVLGNLEASLRK